MGRLGGPARGKSLRWRIVGPLFELLYRNRALYWLASTIPFAGQWRTWQRLALARLRGHEVLEIGCGIGTLLVDMLQAGYSCAAVDRSTQMVAATQGLLHRRRFPRELVQQADVRHLPFPDARFDSVVSTFPTDYIADLTALREIARVLRPGGRLIVVMGASLLPANALLIPFVAIHRLMYGASGSEEPLPETETGVGADTREDAFAALLRRAGLVPRAEAVRGPFWMAHLYLGEKTVDTTA